MKSKISAADRYTIMSAFAASAAIMLVAASAVMVARAYLSASTDSADNEFAPMTYTNTAISEGILPGKTKTDDDYPLESTLNGDTYTYTVPKTAITHNEAGGDKKPVYVRMTYTLSVYDGDVNVSSSYPCTLVALENTNWTLRSDGYYYYNAIVVPDGDTTDLFGGQGVKFTSKKEIPSDLEVKINVIVDTVQAVSTDSSKWTAEDYSTTEVNTAWGVTPTLPDSRAKDQNPVNITWPSGS